jgi:hypothetical protein
VLGFSYGASGDVKAAAATLLGSATATNSKINEHQKIRGLLTKICFRIYFLHRIDVFKIK